MHSISSLGFLLIQLLLVKATSTCYMVNGVLATSDFQPCDKNVTPGSHSACCNLGKDPADICLGSGLCQRMDSSNGNFLIYTVGCTDPTGQDAACQQWCPRTVEMFSLNPCRDSSWCCNNQSETTTCCNDNNRASFQFNLTSLGLEESATVKKSTSSISKGAIVGASVGAFLLGILATGLLGGWFVLRREKRQWRGGVDQQPIALEPPAALSRSAPGSKGPVELSSPVQVAPKY